MDEEEWEEEEHLVVIELKGVIDNEFLYDVKSENCRLLGIDTDEPVLQIGNYTFTGEFKEPVGTHVLFEELVSESHDAQETKKLKYKCNTTKTLEMTRVFLVEKEKAEEEKQEVASSATSAQEHQDPAMDLA